VRGGGGIDPVEFSIGASAKSSFMPQSDMPQSSRFLSHEFILIVYLKDFIFVNTFFPKIF
jgi:hypothetical protein